MLNHTINGKYNICRHIGSGSYGMSWVFDLCSFSRFLGDVFMGYNTISGEDVAIKLEPRSSKHKHLENEYTIYKAIGNHISVPHVEWFGEEHGQKVLILSLFGSSLEDLFVSSECNFKLKTILVIADQLVCFILFFYSFILYLFSCFETSFLIWSSSTLDTLFIAISNLKISFLGVVPP